jgi:hypothetical protein
MSEIQSSRTAKPAIFAFFGPHLNPPEPIYTAAAEEAQNLEQRGQEDKMNAKNCFTPVLLSSL